MSSPNVYPSAMMAVHEEINENHDYMAFHIANGEFISNHFSPRIVQNVIAPSNGPVVCIPPGSDVLLGVRSNRPFSMRIGGYTIGASTPLGNDHVLRVFRGGLPLLNVCLQTIDLIGEPRQEYLVESEVIMDPQQRSSTISPLFFFRQPYVGTFRASGGQLVRIAIDESPPPTLSPNVEYVAEQLSENCLG